MTKRELEAALEQKTQRLHDIVQHCRCLIDCWAAERDKAQAAADGLRPGDWLRDSRLTDVRVYDMAVHQNASVLIELGELTECICKGCDRLRAEKQVAV